MVRLSLSDGIGKAFLFDKYQSDSAALLGFALLTYLEEGPRKCGPNIACSTFPGWPAEVSGLSTRGRKKYNANSSIKQRPLVVAICKVSTLLDTGQGARRRTALISCELSRYIINVAALSETRLPEEGSLVEVGTGYTFSWSGLLKDARGIHGIGYAVRTALLGAPKYLPSQ